MARAWASKGAALRLLCRSVPRQLVDLEGDVEFVLGDVFDANLHGQLFADVEAVYDFLGFSVPATSSMVYECETGLRSLSIILENMAARGIPRIFFPSSGGTIYHDGGGPHREDDELRADCAYAMGKIMSEEMIRYFSRKHGIEYLIGRLSNPYGDPSIGLRRQGIVDVSLNRVLAGKSLELWGDGGQVRDFLFIDDATDILWRLHRQERWNLTVNIGSGRGVSVRDLFALLRETVERDPGLVRRAEAYAGVRHSVLDISRLRGLLGEVALTPLPEGVAETLRRKCAAGGAGSPTCG